MTSLRLPVSPVSAALSILLFGCGETAVESGIDSQDAGSEGWAAGPKADADGDTYDSSVDCNDANSAVHPGATEADNLTDDDCDNYVDETFVSAGDIIVSEINKRSQVGTGGVVNNASWFEVYNDSSRTVDMAYWVIERGTSSSYTQIYLDPASAPVIAAGGRAVFCDTNDYEASAAAYPLHCDYIWGDETQAAGYKGTYHDNTFYLRRDTDTVGIYINGSITTGTKIDSVSYSNAGGFKNFARFSLSLDPAYYDDTANDSGSAWCATTQTSTGTYAASTTWRWYDASGTTKDEYGTPGSENYDCPVDPDLDADGYSGTTDCDDTDATVNPAATEICDGIDNNCDGLIDDAGGYADADGDGYGDPAVVATCSGGTGVANSDDCDDTNALVSPAAAELDDTNDNDCDGWVDEDFVAAGDIVISEINKRSLIGGTSVQNNASWVEIYNTSSRTVDLSNWHFSRGTSSSGNDVYIDSASALTLAPGAFAVLCDTNDYEASSVTYPLSCDYFWGDETQASGYSGTNHDNTMYLRRDSDTIGLRIEGDFSTGRVIDTVSYATGWSNSARFSLNLDTDSMTSTANDSSTGWCSTTANASGVVSASDTWRWYNTSGTTKDEYGTPGATNYDCVNDRDADGYNSLTDCDDTNAAVNPGATESCNGIDDDCDGLIDESGTPLTWYADADVDGYGNAASALSSCAAVTGYVSDATDCNDGSAAVNPGATEVCNNGVDDDCDATTDCEYSGSELIKTNYDFRAYGTAANYSVGSSVSNNGDLNDDGYDDVVVGQSYWDVGTSTDNGRIYVWYGPVSTSDSLSTYDAAFDGSSAQISDYFGSAARFAGDVTGDGKDDLLSAAYMAGTTNTGAAYLFQSGTSATSVTSAYATFTGPSSNAYAGFSIDGGDADGDLRSEVFVGAYGYSSSVGEVGIWNGTGVSGAETFTSSATATIAGTTTAGNLGYAVAVGDLTGDGHVDLLAGAPATASSTTPGALYLFSGVSSLAGSNTIASADATFTGASNGDRFGISVSFIGDSDGDGTTEFIVSADKNDGSATDAGAAYIIGGVTSGSQTGASVADTIIRGQVASDYFGRTVAGVGDSNADTYDDVMVGATAYDWNDGSTTWNGAGALYFFYGPMALGTVSASTYDAQFTGANSSDAVGAALQGGGDVNADGYSDWMSGATSWDGFGYLNSGGSWLFYGQGE